MIRDEVAPGNFVHCWGGRFVIEKKKKKSISDLLQVAADKNYVQQLFAQHKGASQVALLANIACYYKP